MILELSEKVLKCFSLIIQYFRTELTLQIPGEMSDRYEQEYLNIFRSELITLKKRGGEHDMFLKSYIGNYIAGYYKFLIHAKLVENSERVTVDSITSGLNANIRHEYNILNTPNDFSMNHLWVIIKLEHQEYIAKLIDRIYLTSHEILTSYSTTFADVSGALEQFSMANVNKNEFQSNLHAYAKMAEYVINHGVDKHPELKGKKSTKKTTSKIIGIVQEKMQNAGIEMSEDMDLSKFLTDDNGSKFITEIKEDFAHMADSGEVEKNDLMNILISTLDFTRESTAGAQTRESKLIVNTIIQVLKEKNSKNPHIKEQLGPLYSELMKMEDNSVPVDKNLLHRMRQKMDEQERLARLRKRAGKSTMMRPGELMRINKK